MKAANAEGELMQDGLVFRDPRGEGGDWASMPARAFFLRPACASS